MNIATVLSQLASQLATITGLQVYTYPPDSITAPAAAMWPETIDYDQTYGRGVDRMTVHLRVLTGRIDDETAWSKVAEWASGSGTGSVKTVLESGTYSAFDYVHVVDAAFGEFTSAGISYLAAQFTLDIAGRGA